VNLIRYFETYATWLGLAGHIMVMGMHEVVEVIKDVPSVAFHHDKAKSFTPSCDEVEQGQVEE
jgi:hypothetical protein